MKKTVFTMVIALCTATLAVQAGVTVGRKKGPEATESIVLTLTDLNATPPVLSIAESTPMISGSFSAAGDIPSDASFRLTFTGATGWETSAAQAAVLNGTFQSYIDNLNGAQISRPTTGTFGVWSPGDVENADELRSGDVLFAEININGLADQSLVLEQIFFWKYNDKSVTDFLIFDVSENNAIISMWNKNFSNDSKSGAIEGSWMVEDGDIIVMGVGSEERRSYRFRDMTFDIVTKSEPKPEEPSAVVRQVSKPEPKPKRAPAKEPVEEVRKEELTVSSDVSETAANPEKKTSIPLTLLGVVVAVSGVSLLVYRLKNR